MKGRFFRKEKRKNQKLQERHEQSVKEAVQDATISEDLVTNIAFVKNVFGNSGDLIARTFQIAPPLNTNVAIIYLDDMIDKKIVYDFIIRPLMTASGPEQSVREVWETIERRLIQVGEIKIIEKMDQTVENILMGDAVLFIEGFNRVFAVESKGWTTRSIGEPRSESVVRGPREALSETIAQSLSMIRHRLKDPSLRVKTSTVGKRTRTIVRVLYIEGIADPTVVEDVEKRIQAINIDGVLESGYIEEMIEDQTWTPFPLLQSTERPDTVVAHLLEGKVAILVDGTPIALIAPAIFGQFYQSPEDYYERYFVSTSLRFIRLLSLFIAVFLPALYVAFISFNIEMVPSSLVFSMAAGRDPVPFSPLVEVLMMEVSMEILREASIRLPGPMGPTIGIVGGLVVGNAAVSAGFVSPALIIVTGLTAISSYASPVYSATVAVRLIRFPLMILSGIFGFYGILLGAIVLLLHLVQLRSFGIPYMSPFAPTNWSNLKDILIRAPWPWMKKRPSIYRPQDDWRQPKGENG